MVDGRRRPVDLAAYPRAGRYLYRHRQALEAREYVLSSGRQWSEVWVPQDPAAWDRPKLVIRDITEEPTFWIDLAGTIVNGDCYWLAGPQPDTLDLLWLAVAVGNTSFITTFYDHRFNNKLYAGRRRFMTQYVEQFPIPDPHTNTARRIIALAQSIYHRLDVEASVAEQAELDRLVQQAFDVSVEERVR